jgi:hypothetical protein
MLRTYKAVLRGDRVEWIDAPPPETESTPVHITLLDDEAGEHGSRGREMAAALSTLARAGGVATTADPSAWQREVREDRPPPRTRGLMLLSDPFDRPA